MNNPTPQTQLRAAVITMAARLAEDVKEIDSLVRESAYTEALGVMALVRQDRVKLETMLENVARMAREPQT
jgi:hypothetical protein